MALLLLTLIVFGEAQTTAYILSYKHITIIGASPIIQVFQGLRTDIAAQLQQRIELIYMLIQVTLDVTWLRGWKSIGEIISVLSGLATQDDLQLTRSAEQDYRKSRVCH